MLHRYKAVAPNDSDLASSIKDQARIPSALSDNEEHHDAPRIPKGEIVIFIFFYFSKFYWFSKTIG